MKCERCGQELELVEVVNSLTHQTFEVMPGHKAPCGAMCVNSGQFLVGLPDWHTESYCSRGCQVLAGGKR